jgi:hypothetical protein
MLPDVVVVIVIWVIVRHGISCDAPDLRPATLPPRDDVLDGKAAWMIVRCGSSGR